MTRAEIIAFNQGIETVLSLARQTADSLRAKLTEKPTRYPFAIAALDEIADLGIHLLRPVPKGE